MKILRGVKITGFSKGNLSKGNLSKGNLSKYLDENFKHEKKRKAKIKVPGTKNVCVVFLIVILSFRACLYSLNILL